MSKTKPSASKKNNVDMPASKSKSVEVKVKPTKAATSLLADKKPKEKNDGALAKSKLPLKGKISADAVAHKSTAKKSVEEKSEIFLEYENTALASVAIAPSEVAKLSQSQAQRLKTLKENLNFKHILQLTPAAVNLPVPQEYLANQDKILDSLKNVFIDFLRAQDEILINAIYLYANANISLESSRHLEKYRMLKRKNVANLFNATISWGEYNQQINQDLELAKQK
jgi:predicted component of type VI protein secretion system